MKKLLIIIYVFISSAPVFANTKPDTAGWSVSVIPSSVRLDPLNNTIIDNRFVLYKKTAPAEDLLKSNWIYNGKKVSIKGARGEYVSFQVVLTNNDDTALRNINIAVAPFSNQSKKINIQPELFLEWHVEVSTPSTGYPTASLGKGWYPDALIPFEYIQYDSSKVHGRWIYPFWLPDFNNRIPKQKSLIVWVDQYIPFNYGEAHPGKYASVISVSIAGRKKEIPVEMEVWNFAIPNENKLKASLQEEGFLSRMDEKRELEMYQLFKRNRVSLMDPTYDPVLRITADRKPVISWHAFDKRLKKYFTGRAFTKEYGYTYGPGYGEPMETFALPFDVYGKHGTKGWPDIGKPDVERLQPNMDLFSRTVKEVRDHLKPMIDPKKTELTVYLNGLDESYFQQAYERMVFFGNFFKKNYPEASFRIDGAYDDTAMQFVHNSITSWASHTINYDMDKVKKYQALGIKDWLYGPLLYESKVNSWVGSSTFLDLPLVNERAISWSCWKYNTHSWISWGIGVDNKRGWFDPESWKDEYKHGADSDPEFTYKIINGSALMVYAPGIIPNVNGACPSIRLKNMRNGVQEYEYMRLLKSMDKNDVRVNKIVNDVIKEPFGKNAIGNLDVWSFDAALWDMKRIEMGELIHSGIGSKN